MLTMIMASICLFFISLTGWMITTYLIKENSRKLIKEELNNLFDIGKMLLLSIRSMVEILATYSFSSNSEKVMPAKSNEETPAESNKLDEQLLKLVEPVEHPSFSVPVKEDEDTALSSFSPELIEVITEEEEKIA